MRRSCACSYQAFVFSMLHIHAVVYPVHLAVSEIEVTKVADSQFTVFMDPSANHILIRCYHVSNHGTLSKFRFLKSLSLIEQARLTRFQPEFTKILYAA
jgi:hypothetical protein